MAVMLPDQASLARIGAIVRARLAADPSVYRVPTDAAEMFAVGAFLSPDECTHLMAAIDAVAKPSDVYHSVEQAQFRTSSSGDLDPHDSFVKMVERRLGDLTGIDLAWGETIQGQRYYPGQEFRGHYDWFDTAADYWKHEEASGGQRSWTAMVYLNEVEEGGATDFSRISLTIEPQPGALLIWNNALPDGRPNPEVLHAALPVVRGVKYVITKWFRARRWL
jgi:prolyl 4-hydroxylase